MDETRKNIYFVADAHLGARYHRDPLEVEKKLVHWLDSIKHDAQSIWFLGDMFDYWFEYKYVVPKGYTRFLGKLAELADNGVELHLFTGNHDVWMFDYLPQEIGATIHRNPLTVTLHGKNFFIAHGDEADRRSRSFRLVRAAFHSRFCQRLYAAIHPRWTVAFALRWSLHNRKVRVAEPAYLGEDAEYLVAFAKQHHLTHPDIHYYLFGHRHIMLDLMLSRHTRLLIAGDWITHFSYILWDGQTLILSPSADIKP